MIKFNQRDTKWANVIYSAKEPHTETIKSSGCGICSACVVVSNLSDTYIEPPKMAEYSVKKGYRIDGVGTSHSLYPDIAKMYKLNCTKVCDINKAIECVKKGGMAVCSTSGGENKLFSTGGHLFVMTGYNGQECEFYDTDLYSGKYNTAYRKSRCYLKGDLIYVKPEEAKKHIRTYFLFERTKNKMDKNIYSYDNTVEHLIRLGITDIKNMQYWERALAGKEQLNKENVRILFDRLIAKIYERGL